MTVKKRKPPERLFNPADVQASRSARIVRPEVLAKMVSRAENPVLITGGKLLEDDKLVDYAVRIHKHGIAIIATGASSKPLLERGVKPDSCVFTLHHITQFLLDAGWQGFKGKAYDFALFLAFYQPHARFSFPNTLDFHHEILEEFVSALGGGSIGKKED